MRLCQVVLPRIFGLIPCGCQPSQPVTIYMNWNTISIELVHYNDVIMGMMASQITSLTIVYSTIYSGADQRKHQSSASLAFVWGIHRGPVNSPHKGPVTRKVFPFDDVIMRLIMLMSRDGLTFCIYGPLCWESTVTLTSGCSAHGVSNTELWYFIHWQLEQSFEQTAEWLVKWDTLTFT